MNCSRLWYIYKIDCLPSGKSYIGVTCDSVSQRWSNHVCQATKGHSKALFHKAIRQYGRAAFTVSAIAVCSSRESASETERLAISSYATIGPGGYNLALGGLGTPGVHGRHSAETRAKMSAAGKGRIPSKEAKEKMSASRRGKRQSEAAKKKVSDFQRGRVTSVETRKKMSDAVRGRKFPLRSIALLESRLYDAHSPLGARGVICEGRRFTARLGIDGKRVHLGVFDTIAQASAAYQAALIARIAQLKAHHG